MLVVTTISMPIRHYLGYCHDISPFQPCHAEYAYVFATMPLRRYLLPPPDECLRALFRPLRYAYGHFGILLFADTLTFDVDAVTARRQRVPARAALMRMITLRALYAAAMFIEAIGYTAAICAMRRGTCAETRCRAPRDAYVCYLVNIFTRTTRMMPSPRCAEPAHAFDAARKMP